MSRAKGEHVMMDERLTTPGSCVLCLTHHTMLNISVFAAHNYRFIIAHYQQVFTVFFNYFSLTGMLAHFNIK